jgi:phenylacetate-CoA ligase
MPLMSALSRNLFHPLWDFKDGSRRLKVLHELERSQWLPPESLRARQQERLRAIVRYAAEHSPYYQRLFREHHLTAERFDPEAFGALPLLTKAAIRASTADILSREFTPQQLGQHKTGGSTGVALTTYFDRNWLETRTADAMRSDQWAGYYHGMKVAALWGNPPVAKTFKERLRRRLIDRFVYLDTIDLNESSIGAFIAAWRREQPEVLFGHSHSLYMLARTLLEQGISDLRPRGIVSSSMMLLEHERRVIEQAFACKVTDRYGCEEVGLIACECERHAGLHLNVEHLYIEFLRPDGSAAASGEEGFIVITDLLNRGMPFIRYRIEDVGVQSERRCPCGRGLPLMERLTGRVADFLKRRDGSLVAGVSLVERTLTAIPGIEQLQIVQPALDRLLINVVRAADFTASTEEALRQEFRAVFGAEVALDFAYVARIAQERSGKYRFSICRV